MNTKNTDTNLLYEKEGYAIKGACFEVYKQLGTGFLESVYQESLELEFQSRGIPYVVQPLLEISYKDHPLKQFYKPDFICFDKIIVEIKAISCILPEHSAQVINYLKATKLRVGYLVNFGHYPLVETERLIR